MINTVYIAQYNILSLYNIWESIQLDIYIYSNAIAIVLTNDNIVEEEWTSTLLGIISIIGFMSYPIAYALILCLLAFHSIY